MNFDKMEKMFWMNINRINFTVYTARVKPSFFILF